MQYNTGNIDKYETRNPLKKRMVNRLNQRILKEFQILLNQNYACGNAKIKVLDAGCGEGYIDFILMKACPEITLTGLEYTKEAIAIAKKANPSVDYIQGDIRNMPFENHTFDIVLCTEVLEHLDNPERALNELNRVGKNKLVLTVPHEPWFCMGNMLVLKNLSRFGNPVDHINHWNKQSF